MTTSSDAPERARQIQVPPIIPDPFPDLGGQMRNTFKDFISILRAQYYGAEKPKDPDKILPQDAARYSRARITGKTGGGRSGTRSGISIPSSSCSG